MQNNPNSGMKMTGEKIAWGDKQIFITLE